MPPAPRPPSSLPSSFCPRASTDALRQMVRRFDSDQLAETDRKRRRSLNADRRQMGLPSLRKARSAPRERTASQGPRPRVVTPPPARAQELSEWSPGYGPPATVPLSEYSPLVGPPALRDVEVDQRGDGSARPPPPSRRALMLRDRGPEVEMGTAQGATLAGWTAADTEVAAASLFPPLPRRPSRTCSSIYRRDVSEEVAPVAAPAVPPARAASRYGRGAAAGPEARHAYSARRSLDSEAVGDLVHLETATVAMGRYARDPPSRVAELSAGERMMLDGAGMDALAAGPIRRGVEGWSEVSKHTERQPQTIRDHVRYWNIYVKAFCDLEGYDPWHASATVFELFVGHMYELGGKLSIDRFPSAINYMHKAFGLTVSMEGGRYAEAKKAFKSAAQLRARKAGKTTTRALIPDHAAIHMTNDLVVFEQQGNWVKCDQGFMIFAKLIMWVRAVTLGASEPGDFALGPGGDCLLCNICKTKCGNEEFVPTQLSIPFPDPESTNEVAKTVMGFMKRTLLRNPRICASSMGLTRKNAASMLTTWMTDFMPPEVTMLPPGSFISSHSSRDTGATHARISVQPRVDWDTVMSWGGWKSELRAKGYIKSGAQVSEFWRQFYYWLSPSFVKRHSVAFPRQGYAEDAPVPMGGAGPVVEIPIALPMAAGALLQCPRCETRMRCPAACDRVKCPRCPHQLGPESAIGGYGEEA